MPPPLSSVLPKRGRGLKEGGEARPAAWGELGGAERESNASRGVGGPDGSCSVTLM